ncbi:MAG: hypothetical protein M1821_007324 [Bathelium mastoideum]|nr:MAG: hypothetical protein M1821_007324 [Bathelium mastoideum]
MQSAFEKTVVEFQNDLKPEEKRNFEFTRLDDVKAVIISIQEDQENRRTLRHLERIRPFLDAMESFSHVIEVYLNASQFVCYIWGPLKFLLQTASNYADSFEKLLEAYRMIGEQVPVLSQYSQLFSNHPEMQEILQLIYADILEFHKKAIKFFSRPVWRQLLSSTWKDFKIRFDKILVRLQSHKGLLSEQATLASYRQRQRDSEGLHDFFQESALSRQQISLYIERYEKDRNHFETLEEDRARAKKIGVLQWISGAQSESDHEAQCAIRESCPGSGNWILKNPKIETWKVSQAPPSSIAWLNGKPGAGKTVLASAIIQSCQASKDAMTTYFYCSQGDPERNNAIAVFKGLLSQCLDQCPELLPYCEEKRNGELTLSNPKTIKDLLKLFSEFVPKQYIIVDGLDECEGNNFKERKEIMAFLNQLVKDSDARAPAKLRVLFVSQSFSDISRELSTAMTITLGPEDNKHDIKAYVYQQAEKLRVKFGLNEEQSIQIQEKTCLRADGMFLFTVLVMTNLLNQVTLGDFLVEVSENRFPRDLKNAYERILSSLERNLSEKEWQTAKLLLGWMVCAKRPLKWHEIQAAVSMDSTDQTIFSEEMILRVGAVDLCGSLVQVRPRGRVELVHSTARTYIADSEHVNTMIVECDLTVLCLEYLTFHCFTEIDESGLAQYTRRGYFALQDYAIAKWHHHVDTIVSMGGKLLLEAQKNQVNLDGLEQALDDFANVYEDDLPDEQDLPEARATKDCEPFRACETLYGYLLPLWDHILKHEAGKFENRDVVSMASLASSLKRSRGVIEGLTKDTSLEEFYGTKLFKCHKLTCFYFHEGFTDKKSRDQHVNRHERPFVCQVPDCKDADFGFTTSKDLRKHMQLSHEEQCDKEGSFSPPKRGASDKTRFVCTTCSANFTRHINLISHQRAHKGERPFVCPECGKRFTRESDCKRHQKIHDRGR